MFTNTRDIYLLNPGESHDLLLTWLVKINVEQHLKYVYSDMCVLSIRTLTAALDIQQIFFFF